MDIIQIFLIKNECLHLINLHTFFLLSLKQGTDKRSANQIRILGAAYRNQVYLTQRNTVTGAGDNVESAIASVHLKAYYLEGKTS